MIYVTVTAGYIIFFFLGYLLGCLMSKKDGNEKYAELLQRIYDKLKAEIDRPAEKPVFRCTKCREIIRGDEDSLCGSCVTGL